MSKGLIKCSSALLAFAALGSIASAANIYVFATGDNGLDADVILSLNQAGHNAVLGQGVSSFTNLNVIASYDAVYLQANYNYGFYWDHTQQQAMVDYINSGGGVVSAEWVMWMNAVNPAYFDLLRTTWGSEPNSSWDGRASIDYVRSSNDPIMNNGVPAAFTTLTSSVAGVYTYVTSLQPGGIEFYHDANGSTVIGKSVGNGRTVNFNTVNGHNQLFDPNFRKVLRNAFDWTTSNPPTGPGITGHVTLQNFVGTYPLHASVRYINHDNHVGSGRVTADLSAGGTLTGAGPNVPGTYDVVIKASHWLARTTLVTTSTGNTANFGSISLLNGDCDGDNQVGLSDYGILSSAYGSEIGDFNYVDRADLDGNGEVGIADYGILSANYGEEGE